MKKVFSAALALLLILSALSGCYKTPDSPIVVGKNSEQMLEAAQKSDTDQKNENAESVNLYDRLNAPSNYKVELTSKKSRLSVYTNAQILLPSFELPIIRVKPAEFTLEQVERFAEVLMGSNAKFVEFDEDQQTKAAYERQIENLRAGIENWEEIGQHVYDLQYNSKEEAERAPSELLIKAANAPDSLPAIMPNFIWSKPHITTENGEVEHNNTYEAPSGVWSG